MTDSIRQRPDSRIVVGVDGSDASKEALRWAGRRPKLTGASLHVVMNWHVAPAAYGMTMPMPVSAS